MTYQQWHDKYQAKTGCTLTEMEGYTIEFYPEKGFCQWGVVERDGIRAIDVCHTATDDVWWWIKLLAYRGWQNNCQWLHTMTNRNPKAYCKLTGTTPYPATDAEVNGVKFYGMIKYIGNKPDGFKEVQDVSI
jgi:hypothetical protein